MTRDLCDWIACNLGPGSRPAEAVVRCHNFMDLQAPWMNLCRDHLLDYLETTPFVSAKVIAPNPLFLLRDLEAVEQC